MVPLNRSVALVLLVLAVTAGCGSSSGAKGVSSSAELQRALDTRGVGCDGYEPATASEKQKYVNEQGYCQIQGDSAILYVFRTQSDLRSWTTLGIAAGCSSGFPVVTFDQGPNWIIQTTTPAVTEAIKAHVGGSAVVHRC